MTLKNRKLIIASSLGLLLLATGVITRSISPSVNPATLSQADLKFGESELNRMLADLPEMKQWIKVGNPLWTIAVKQFAGEAIGQHIEWDSTKLDEMDFFASHNSSPHSGKLASISLQRCDHDGKQIGAEELCRHFFFETFNIRNHSKFVREFQLACFTKTSREDYVQKNAKLEYAAIRAIANFYQQTVKPWADQSKIKTHPGMWNVPLDPTFEIWMKQYTDRSGYPWRFWGAQYDNFVAPYHRIWSNKP